MQEKRIARFTDDIARLKKEGTEEALLSWDDKKTGNWVQWTNRGVLNFRYPYLEEPDKVLSRMGIELPPGSSLVDWSSKESATYRCGSSEPEVVATIVDKIFLKLLRAELSFKVATDFALKG